MQNFNEPTDKLILIYGTDDRGIETTTLTLTLNMFQEIFYQINEILYPDEKVEFIIERIEDGSIWVTIRKVAVVAATSITFGVFGNIVYAKLYPPKNPKVDGIVIVDGDRAVIKLDDKTFSIPIDSLAAYEKIRKDKFINGRIVEAFGKLRSDDRVAYFGLAVDNTRVKKPIIIPRENFSELSRTYEINTSEINHPDVTLEVLNTTFNQPNFSGQFKWGDKIIQAKITDNDFTYSPGRRNKVFTSGKLINVRMVETKTNDYYTEEQIHSSFEIVKVYTE